MVGVVVMIEDDGPATDAGSSKSNVSGFGARVGCSLIGRKRTSQHNDRTHDYEALRTRLLILPSQHRLTESFATVCKLQEKREGPWTVLKVLRVLYDQRS